MRCETVQRLVSAGMDEPVARPLPEDVTAHAATCPACRAFAEGSWRIRKASRLEVAPVVPDLTSSIMERVAAEQATRTRSRGLRPPALRRWAVRRGTPRRARPLRRA